MIEPCNDEGACKKKRGRKKFSKASQVELKTKANDRACKQINHRQNGSNQTSLNSKLLEQVIR